MIALVLGSSLFLPWYAFGPLVEIHGAAMGIGFLLMFGLRAWQRLGLRTVLWTNLLLWRWIAEPSEVPVPPEVVAFSVVCLLMSLVPGPEETLLERRLRYLSGMFLGCGALGFGWPVAAAPIFLQRGAIAVINTLWLRVKARWARDKGRWAAARRARRMVWSTPGPASTALEKLAAERPVETAARIRALYL